MEGGCKVAAFVIFLAALAAVALMVVKAVYSVRLAEKSPEEYERWRQAEEDKARRRQEMLGKATIGGVEMVKWWFKKGG
jgi:hypothetical protein